VRRRGADCAAARAAGGPGGALLSALVEAEGLGYAYGDGESRKDVLSGISLALAAGELVIMSGPSGSGKTTLLSLIGSLRRPQTGRLLVLGRDLQTLGANELLRHRREIGFIFQHHNLFPALTARQSVEMALELSPLAPNERRERARAMLEALGLGHRLGHKPGRLSGGQRQRVAVARALVTRPRLLLADEPTAALDKESGHTVLDLFEGLVRDGGSVVMVTHDTRLLARADRMINLVDGRVVSDVRVKQMVELCTYLRNSGLFGEHSPAELMEVAQKMRLERFAAGQDVVRQGSEGERFYLLRSGRVEVLVERDGTTSSVARLERGAYFGERALIVKEPRNATVRALETLETYSLDKQDFEAAIARTGSFQDQLLQTILLRS
jgi:putative ABC transport system ATP-binding protein